MITQKEYKEYCAEFKKIERYLQINSASPDIVAYNICKLREYYPDRMSAILKKAGFLFIEDNSVYSKLMGVGSEFGLFKDGRFLLEGRFIFPVRDMLGNTVALIGWFPDDKKYITTPSMLFSKSCMYYGMEQLGETGLGKNYFLCEGIFDVLSLRSIGLNAVGQMGITSGRVKEVNYSLFKRIIAVPDNDTQGREVVEKDKWSLISNGSYFQWKGDPSKDIDLLVNSYDAAEMKAFLESLFQKTDKRIIERI